MTAHDHAEFVAGCFRCDLGREEALAAVVRERDEAINLLRELVSVDPRTPAAAARRAYVRDWLFVEGHAG